MGDPMQAHQMLYEKDRESAERYARDLEELNTQRKGEVKDIISTISFDHSVYQNDVVVVGDLSWGPGILGLIAQKIIDETGKPVFVWGFGSSQPTAEGIYSEQSEENSMGGQITTEGIELENLEKDNRGKASDKIILKGSCRSLGDISVVDLMAHAGKTSAGGVFEGYGGHEGAGGFSLLFENVDKLSDALNESFKHIEKKRYKRMVWR
jgi:single-stranded DNA-specific DHH superfamily exonuclease